MLIPNKNGTFNIETINDNSQLIMSLVRSDYTCAVDIQCNGKNNKQKPIFQDVEHI